MAQAKEPRWHQVVRILFLLGVLGSPIVVYMVTFGTQISNSHSRWGEMGSAFSGIYTPILSILTLGVLALQVRLQGQMNEHTYNQNYIQDARSDVQFCLAELAAEFAKDFGNGQTLGQMLIATYAFTPPEVLQTQNYVEASVSLDLNRHRLMALWTNYYSVLEGLRQYDFPPHNHQFSTAKTKAITALSYAGCAALDNYTWCRTEGHLPPSHEFAQQLDQAGTFTHQP